ncbi:MAG: hypothetical protein ACKVRP_09000 [Bacteroidota bacterium]
MRSATFLLVLIASVLIVSQFGCEIVTEDPPLPDLRPAPTVVINEVFTLPITHPSFYSWIEFINPTNQMVEITDWTLGMTTFRQLSTILVRTTSAGGFQLLNQTIVVDSFGVFDVPLAQPLSFNSADIPGIYEDTIRLTPNTLLTMVNNESRLLAHTDYGPEDERFIKVVGLFEGPLVSVDTLAASDTSVTLQIRYNSYSFVVQTTDQLVLKDETGAVVDVVRFGNYVFTGPGSDPYPLNPSIGLVPEFEAISRYAGGFFTGNSAFDFYVTDDGTRPIPHAYNQAYRIKD